MGVHQAENYPDVLDELLFMIMISRTSFGARLKLGVKDRGTLVMKDMHVKAERQRICKSAAVTVLYCDAPVLAAMAAF